MLIGCPKEIKPQEFRVGLTPAAVREAVAHGHDVIIETGAGLGAGFDDAAYLAAGAEIVATAEAVFARADMVVKVKEPQAIERARLREGQILFTYLHLAPDPDQTRDQIRFKKRSNLVFLKTLKKLKLKLLIALILKTGDVLLKVCQEMKKLRMLVANLICMISDLLVLNLIMRKLQKKLDLKNHML